MNTESRFRLPKTVQGIHLSAAGYADCSLPERSRMEGFGERQSKFHSLEQILTSDAPCPDFYFSFNLLALLSAEPDLQCDYPMSDVSVSRFSASVVGD